MQVLILSALLFLFSPSFVFADEPIISGLSNDSMVESQTYSATGSFTDSDPANCTATVDYGDGSGVQPLALDGNTFSLEHVYQDNGWFTVAVTITDNYNISSTETATIQVDNVTPEIIELNFSAVPTAISAASTMTASFTDWGTVDTHTAVWDWGDGSTSAGTITELNGSGTVTGSHTYSAGGVYTVNLTLSDDDESSSSLSHQYITKYIAQGRYLGGAMTFTALPGSIASNPLSSSEVTFGVQAHQSLLPLIPLTGNLEVEARNVYFSSTDMTLFTVVGLLATLTGTGEFYGNPGYNFTVTATDGQKILGGGVDRIRIRITDANGVAVFDNELGEPDLLNLGSVLTSGNIIVP